MMNNASYDEFGLEMQDALPALASESHHLSLAVGMFPYPNLETEISSSLSDANSLP